MTLRASGKNHPGGIVKNQLKTLATIATMASSLAGCAMDNTVDERIDAAQQAAVALAQPPAAPVVLTFSARYDSKLFINGTKAVNCLADAPLLANPLQKAAFTAFCLKAGVTYVENPPTGAAVAPALDARILERHDREWKCSTANNGTLVGPAVLNGVTRLGGREPLPNGGFVLGVVNPFSIRNQMLVNGSWGYTASGHPNPVVEPGFLAAFPRLRPDIWHRLRGTTTCGVDARGLPTSATNYVLTHTKFPSHRVWKTTPNRPKVAAAVLFNIAQGSFGNLWRLPAIAAP
jgi:hypothetical protein